MNFQIKNLKEGYIFSNKIILILLIIVLIYPYVALKFNIQKQCDLKNYINKECPSCGMTRGLNECYTFNFKKANNYNNQSVFFYFCTIFQIILRSYIVLIKIKNVKRTIIFDVLIIVIMYLIIKNNIWIK